MGEYPAELVRLLYGSPLVTYSAIEIS
jgi:hypothetical protein